MHPRVFNALPVFLFFFPSFFNTETKISQDYRNISIKTVERLLILLHKIDYRD